jgi:neutral trehalase
VNKRDFPKIHFYDQDFVDIYDKTWTWLQDFYIDPHTGEPDVDGYFLYPGSGTGNYVLDQTESIFSTFFLVYSNRNYTASKNLDFLYEKQEENGAIRWKYDVKTGVPLFTADNPEGVGLPLFAWAEFNLFHKSANKRRVKEIVPVLVRFMSWIDAAFRQPNGLYNAPAVASTMYNSPRDGTVYPVDFNTALAINALYLSSLGDILNDKDMSFQYKRLYFSLKTRINSLMWTPDTGLYHDLDGDEKRLPHKTIAGFWPLLAEIPNEEKAEMLVANLRDPATFGTEHPFPTLSADDPRFSANGEGFCGSVYPPFNFMVIKGLEKYQRWDLARESAIKHLYFILDAYAPGSIDMSNGDIWEAYKPKGDGSAITENEDHTIIPGGGEFPRKRFLPYVGLSTIALMIESVVGIIISLPRKTVDWIIPNMEVMGIENLALKRNMITILSNKNLRGWEIQLESEKLYYFTINIIGKKKKTLPIPSGKCSMLIDKL